MNGRVMMAVVGLMLVVGGSMRVARAAEFKPLGSRMFEAVKYDGATRTLTLLFHTGSAYAFYEVPRQVYDDFLRIVNRGEYFNRRIKKVYRYERLDKYPGSWCARE